ncbi:GNAT family N-acetyltransferase [Bacillus infantis]|uniref:GNAT family N-acetyltransferase n=1 Tax=Bacillus infantis TaxID=324767 RepID=UPI001CD7F040|nr:GNAT family N-acetyltransferase [Bacillus infantis]MCA1036931.1 GNAT family N-acetyltransferase [Bacillus infantis]
MLTVRQLKEIKELQDICENHEDFRLKLNWDMLKSRNNETKTDFFTYQDGRLTGFLALYPFGAKVEVCGMVHPEYRKKGLFTALLKQAEKQLASASEVLLNAPAESYAAKQLFQSLPCRYSFTEHQMKYFHSDTLSEKEGVEIRSASAGDAGLCIQLDIVCFSLSEEDATLFYGQTAAEQAQTLFIIEYCGVPAGKVRIQTDGNESWIYGFAILPEFQRRGIGRSVLSRIIRQERNRGRDIFLEVAAENNNALNLYTSCGFVPLESQDYYQLKLN